MSPKHESVSPKHESKSYSHTRNSCKQGMQITNGILLIYVKAVSIDAKEIRNLRSSKGRASQCEMQNVSSG